jgi:hypothetical protein
MQCARIVITVLRAYSSTTWPQAHKMSQGTLYSLQICKQLQFKFSSAARLSLPDLCFEFMMTRA